MKYFADNQQCGILRYNISNFLLNKAPYQPKKNTESDKCPKLPLYMRIFQLLKTIQIFVIQMLRKKYLAKFLYLIMEKDYICRT